jgi:hypothetical protein
MLNEKETFLRFGKSFQENLCQLMLDDRPFCDQVSEVIDVAFFELKYLQVFVEVLLAYREKYRSHPNHEIMMTELKSGMQNQDKVVADQVRHFYARIYNSEGVEGD